MAQTAKKTELAPVINLTKPNKSSTTGGSPKLEIKGLEAVVARMRQRHMQIESAQTEQKLDEEQMLGAVKAQRLTSEEAGHFYKTIVVDSADGIPAKIIFKNMFKQIDTCHETELREHLKKGYDPLFETKYEVKLRDNSAATYEKLQQLLGNNLTLLFEVTPFIAPKDSFMEKRAQMRPLLDKKVNTVLDSVVDQAQYKAQVSLK